MENEQRKIKKQIKVLSRSIQEFESEEKSFLELSKRYQCNRNRVHNEILHKYTDLFAIIENVRALSIVGIQNIDLLVKKSEVDFKSCIKRYHVLKPIMIKYMDVFDEIVCLVKNGFTDGAMQRWRTFFEYSVIIMFILQQGEFVADAYANNFAKLWKDDLRIRTNYEWAKAADCLKQEKQISIRKLLNNLYGIDATFVRFSLVLYKLTSQVIHGSTIGVNMSFNDHISEEIGNMDEKHGDYYKGGISTVISHTFFLLFQTFIIYFSTFPDGGVEIKSLWKSFNDKYKEIFSKSGL